MVPTSNSLGTISLYPGNFLRFLYLILALIRGRITYRSSGTCSSYVWKDSREVWYHINMLQGTFNNLECSIISIMEGIDKYSTHIWVSRNFICYFISQQAPHRSKIVFTAEGSSVLARTATSPSRKGVTKRLPLVSPF
ncbi:hypothetical protein QYF36_001608 [Acer negundo]|nr:hypothetical protein QYF36_001608 [Acer negundo]